MITAPQLTILYRIIKSHKFISASYSEAGHTYHTSIAIDDFIHMLRNGNLKEIKILPPSAGANPALVIFSTNSITYIGNAIYKCN